MPNPVDIHVGVRLRMRRTMLGLSQNKMGDLIGVTFQQIQKYEKGVNRIGSSRLYQISKILLIPVSYFFEGYEEEGESNSEITKVSKGKEEVLFRHEDLDNKEIAQLVKNFIRISNPSVRKSVITLAKSLAMKEEEGGGE
ncbi:helix-turn-helix domain-containing protein [Pseudomonadota bacterium]